MQFLRVSLLSPLKKGKLQKLIQFLFTKELLEMVIFTCTILAVTQLVGWLILTRSVSDLAQTSLLVNRETPPFVQDIRRVNKLAKDLLASGQDFYPISPRLYDIIDSLPPNIKLSAVIIDRENQTAEIDGLAATRDAFLMYQDILTSIPWITDVSSPVSQLFQKENIGFEFHMKLKNIPKLKPLPKVNQRRAPSDS